jgi:Domain of unknown function (DUF5615)
MRLYLDDDMDANELIGLLQHEGHEVMSPRTAAMRGAEDEAYLRYAAAEQYVLLTANVRDFLTLHQRWQEEGRYHDGILALYREKNPRRDMTYAQIARAVSHLEGANLPLQNTCQNLNMWRDPSHR